MQEVWASYVKGPAGKKRGHHSGREGHGLASVTVWILPLDMLARLAVMPAENEEISEQIGDTEGQLRS